VLLRDSSGVITNDTTERSGWTTATNSSHATKEFRLGSRSSSLSNNSNNSEKNKKPPPSSVRIFHDNDAFCTVPINGSFADEGIDMLLSLSQYLTQQLQWIQRRGRCNRKSQRGCWHLPSILTATRS